MDRVRLLRNAVMCQVAAVGCFVFTSLLLGLRVSGPEWAAVVHPLPVFVIGMGVLFAGVVFEGPTSCARIHDPARGRRPP